MIENILLTGVTGSVGQSLLAQLLIQKNKATVFCLVREAHGESAQERLNQILKNLSAREMGIPNIYSRVVCVPGDVSLPHLGLSITDRDMLTHHVTSILHLAANVEFTLCADVSRELNVESTRRMLEFAVSCKRSSFEFFKFHYVSTAFVAGKKTGLLRENECGSDRYGFWNNYEMSKAEAEALVHTYDGRLQTVIYRPSQVIGDSKSGQFVKHMGLYEYIELAIRGKGRVLVGDANAKMDMIPSDYVCRAILALMDRNDVLGKTYYLAAGLKHSLTMGEIVDKVYEVLSDHAPPGRPVHKPVIVAAEAIESSLSPQELRAFNRSPQKVLLRSYLPYMAYERDFDVGATHALLDSLGVRMPNMDTVVKNTAVYAVLRRRAALAALAADASVDREVEVD